MLVFLSYVDIRRGKRWMHGYTTRNLARAEQKSKTSHEPIRDSPFPTAVPSAPILLQHKTLPMKPPDILHPLMKLNQIRILKRYVQINRPPLSRRPHRPREARELLVRNLGPVYVVDPELAVVVFRVGFCC